MVPSHQILNDKNRPPRVQRPARYKTKHTRRIITRTYYAIISSFGSGGIPGLYGHIAPSVTCDDPTGRPLPCNRYIGGSECVHNGYHIPRNMGCIPLTSEYTCTLQENIYKWHQINGSKYPSCDSVSDHWHYCLIITQQIILEHVRIIGMGYNGVVTQVCDSVSISGTACQAITVRCLA
eukprot:113911_1